MLWLPLHQLAVSDAGHPVLQVQVRVSLDKQGSLYCYKKK